jgi:hypothetical protein
MQWTYQPVFYSNQLHKSITVQLLFYSVSSYIVLAVFGHHQGGY